MSDAELPTNRPCPATTRTSDVPKSLRQRENLDRTWRRIRTVAGPTFALAPKFTLAPKFPLCVILIPLLVIAGCGQFAHRLTTRAPDKFVPNPIELPHASDDFVWSQVVDAVDDYFRIAREQPVQNRGDVVLDGRIETAYQIGGSIFEPWRKDSTAGFERMQSTLQTIRRRAIVTVRPRPRGYTLEVVVQKDLEDTDRSQYSTESTAGRRHDGTVVRQEDRYDDSPITLGWIPLGRDASLEQVILRDIFDRITKADAPRHH